MFPPEAQHFKMSAHSLLFYNGMSFLQQLRDVSTHEIVKRKMSNYPYNVNPHGSNDEANSQYIFYILYYFYM